MYRKCEGCEGKGGGKLALYPGLVPLVIYGEKKHEHRGKTWTWGLEEGQMVESKESRRINRFHLSLWGSMAARVITKFM